MGLSITEDNVNLLINIRDYAESQSKLYLYTIPMLKQLRKL